jgi:predicted ATPase
VQADIADTSATGTATDAMKGEPQPVFAVTGISHHRAARLPEPAYRLPMVGRQAELAFIDEKLKLALQGKGQVIGITAEAGMGKSRLIAEVIRLARKRGFTGYGGACQSSGTNTPYLVWQPIWQAFFDLDPEMPQRKQIRLLEGELEDRVPERLDSLPLLGLVLNLPLPDNEFTGALDPKDRKSALEILLEDCLKSAIRETPLLIVLEDLHWVDPLSHDLLETLARVSENLPICFVLAYRPPALVRLQEQRVEKLPHFTRVELQDLTASDAEQLIRAKLAQLFPERTGALPKALAEELTLKSQGNPFFIEELINYLHDRGLNPYDTHALKELELPASLQTLILSRIDQLTEPQKVTLKVASIIGRVYMDTILHWARKTSSKVILPNYPNWILRLWTRLILSWLISSNISSLRK